MEGEQHQAPQAPGRRSALASALDLEDQRLIARQVFEYQNARIQGVLHMPLVFMIMIYPTLLGFCLAARLGRFNLMVPTPYLNTTPPGAAELGSKKDLWRTNSSGDVVLLSFTFVFITAVHIYLASFLVMRPPPGVAYMSLKLSWVAPILFWGVTTTYFLCYIKMARYGPWKGEWIGAGVSSAFILFVTLCMIAFPCKTGNVVLGRAGPGGGGLAGPREG